jgi:hypothetical protein
LPAAAECSTPDINKLLKDFSINVPHDAGRQQSWYPRPPASSCGVAGSGMLDPSVPSLSEKKLRIQRARCRHGRGCGTKRKNNAKKLRKPKNETDAQLTAGGPELHCILFHRFCSGSGVPMAVRIRMKKMGRKHRPFFRICVMDSRVAARR